MDDALPLFALATAVCSFGFVAWILGHFWLRARELERRSGSAGLDEPSASVAEVLARMEARLARLEESVDATAIEVERIAEAQRFAARRLSAEGGAPDEGSAAARLLPASPPGAKRS